MTSERLEYLEESAEQTGNGTVLVLVDEIRRLRALGLAQLAELKTLAVTVCLYAQGSVSGAEALHGQRKKEWDGEK